MDKIRINCYEMTTINNRILLTHNRFTEVSMGDKNYSKYRKLLDKSPRGKAAW